jgi:hypothetical protein
VTLAVTLKMVKDNKCVNTALEIKNGKDDNLANKNKSSGSCSTDIAPTFS